MTLEQIILQLSQQSEAECKDTVAQFDTDLYRSKNGGQHVQTLSDLIRSKHSLDATEEHIRDFIIPRRDYVKQLIKSGMDQAQIRTNLNNSPFHQSMDNATIECIRDTVLRDEISKNYKISDPEDVENIKNLHEKMSSGQKFTSTEFSYIRDKSGNGSLNDIVQMMITCKKAASPTSEHSNIDANSNYYLNALHTSSSNTNRPVNPPIEDNKYDDGGKSKIAIDEILEEAKKIAEESGEHYKLCEKDCDHSHYQREHDIEKIVRETKIEIPTKHDLWKIKQIVKDPGCNDNDYDW